jgi:hypothetical protein
LSHGHCTSGHLFLEEYYTLALIGKAGLGTPHMDANTRLCTGAALKEISDPTVSLVLQRHRVVRRDLPVRAQYGRRRQQNSAAPARVGSRLLRDLHDLYALASFVD